MSARETAIQVFSQLAPKWLYQTILTRQMRAGIDWSNHGGEGKRADLATAEVIHSANQLDVGTLDQRGRQIPVKHAVMVDIDVRAALVPSSTPGHHHLYFDVEVPFASLMKLLEAMHECGLVEQCFVDQTRDSGHADLRLPWVRKGQENDPEATPTDLSEWFLAQYDDHQAMNGLSPDL